MFEYKKFELDRFSHSRYLLLANDFFVYSSGSDSVAPMIIGYIENPTIRAHNMIYDVLSSFQLFVVVPYAIKMIAATSIAIPKTREPIIICNTLIIRITLP